MVGFRVEMKQLVVRFPEWEKLSCYFPVTPMNSFSKRIVSAVIGCPSFLNKAMVFFLILSSVGSLLLLIALSPSSLYIPTFSFPIKLNNLSISRLVHKSLLHRNIPLLRQIMCRVLF